MMYFAPGDPGTSILGTSVMPEAIQEFNEEIGWNDPFLVRFWDFLSGLVFRFDLGTSWVTGRPVLVEISERIGVTVKIATFCMVTAVMVGIPIGVLSAVKQYSITDRVSTFLALLLAATPSFWLSMSCIFLFALKLGWFPAFGSESVKHFILPALSLGIPYAAGILRQCRSSMLDCIRQDYVDTAKSKGIPKRRVIWKHTFNNAVLPVITSAGGSFGALIGGAVVTEQLYGISGLGTLLSSAIKSRDVPLVCGTVVVIACIFSHGISCLWYLIVFAVVMVIGFAVDQSRKKK
jgi:peptide/nickel transport system permease protein